MNKNKDTVDTSSFQLRKIDVHGRGPMVKSRRPTDDDERLITRQKTGTALSIS